MQLRIWWSFVAWMLVLCFLIGPVAASLDNLPTPQGKGIAYKRVIADRVSAEDTKLFKARGCIVKHRLKNAVSLDCPVEVVPTLNVKESRIYRILDINADRQIGADLVWGEGITGYGVNVAILDTGIDTDHPNLYDSYLGGYDCVNNDESPEDDHGHGTHVAGIITSDGDVYKDSKGVAPGTGIYMYKVCDAQGHCYEDDMECGMERAVLTDAKVMSISIGGGSYTSEDCDGDPLAILVNQVADAGLTVVVAAGNGGRGVASPGCASGVIAVGAVDSGDSVPYWSGRGPALDIVAPGVSIYSTVRGGGAGRMSGTSMAAPHLAGVVALLLQANPGLTTSDIKSALYDTATPVSTCYQCLRWGSSGCQSQGTVPCTSDITGAGVVDAYGAYASVQHLVPACSVDADCDDHLSCNGMERCDSGRCIPGTPTDCSALGGDCTIGVCDEVSGCIAQWKADGTSCPSDGVYCNGPETCQSGICTHITPIDCGDGIACTSDTCNEATDSCNHVWPECGLLLNGGSSDGCCGPQCSAVNDSDCLQAQCWSGANQYLYPTGSQAKKFCKCASGAYGYQTTSRGSSRRVNVYGYMDTGNNTKWGVYRTSVMYPIVGVTCPNGVFYSTAANYFL
jgi:hypothetical protein